ncbi:MAG: 30S ribosomal protein S1 [Clostridium sp.]|nr:30S ribosomal protein S1 [Clostridium sp.]
MKSMDENNNKEMSMEEAMEDFSLNKIKDGDVLEGSIIKVNKDEVIVNINHFADGVVLRDELTDRHHEDLTETYNVGDKIKVIVLKADDGEGNVLLSKLQADAIVARDEVEKAFENQEPLTVHLKDVVKGGLRASYHGLSGFMPASLLSDRYIEDLSAFADKDVEAFVEEYDEANRKLIFSRRAYLKKMGEANKIKLLETLKEGQTVEGEVSNITTYGAFIDLGGLIGLAHISDLSYGRINHPSEVVTQGDKVTVQILKIDRKKEKISLSLKNNEEDPWSKIHELKIGNTYDARIKKIIDVGAIVELKEGYDGLVHISEISDQHVTDIHEILTEGDEVQVKLLSIDEDKKRVSFSIKDAGGAGGDFYDEEHDEVTLGDVFKDLMDKFKGED